MAWEIKPPRVCVGILIGGETVYKDMLKVAFGLWREPNWLFLFETQKPDVALSRNIIASMALKEGCEWLFFLDSDVVPGNDVVFRLMSHNIPLVSGLYWRRHPNLEPCMYKLSPEGIPVTFQPHEVGQGILQEAEAAGAGCLLINKIVLEKMAPTVESFELLNAETKETMVVHKFFEYIIKDKVTLSEDVVFFSRAKNLGFKLMVDTGVRCGHLSTAMVKEGRFNYTPLTLGYEI